MYTSLKRVVVVLITLIIILGFALMPNTGAAAPAFAKPPTKTSTPIGPTATPGGATATPSTSDTITVSGSPWGVSTCYIGATEGNVRFDVADLQAAGINTYRIYGGDTPWATLGADWLFFFPTTCQSKAHS